MEPTFQSCSGVATPPDWSDLLPELVAEIAIRLPEMEDFSAFRGVCKPWRAAATKDKFKGLSKIPFLMLAEKDGGSDDRQLYSLSRKRVWTTMSLPWFKNKRCMDVGFGWAITVAAEGGEVNLVKSFTGVTMELPNQTNFPGYTDLKWPEHSYIFRGMLSADPSLTSDFVLMVHTPTKGLVFWRLGDANWRMVDDRVPGYSRIYKNIGCYEGKMVDIDWLGNVCMRDPSAADFTKSDLIASVALEHYYSGTRPYIVESSSGELLLILRHNVYQGEYGQNEFQTWFSVARILLSENWHRSYERMDGIGNDAVFLGENVAVCVDAVDFPGVIRPNCIYYTDDCIDVFWRGYPDNRGGGRDMGIYNFEDDSIERFPVGESLSSLCPPLWIFPF